MRVLLLAPLLPRPQDNGGRIRLAAVADCLARAGHEVTLLAGAVRGALPVTVDGLRMVTYPREALLPAVAPSRGCVGVRRPSGSLDGTRAPARGGAGLADARSRPG